VPCTGAGRAVEGGVGFGSGIAGQVEGAVAERAIAGSWLNIEGEEFREAACGKTELRGELL
jgi:hypothetical protein